MSQKRPPPEDGDQSRSKSGGGRKKLGCPPSKSIIECFKRVEEEIDCVVCGQKVKRGVFRTHERDCRLKPDDEDIIFLEEIEPTQKPAPENPASEDAFLFPKRNRSSSGGAQIIFSSQIDIPMEVTDEQSSWSNRLRTRPSTQPFGFPLCSSPIIDIDSGTVEADQAPSTSVNYLDPDVFEVSSDSGNIQDEPNENTTASNDVPVIVSVRSLRQFQEVLEETVDSRSNMNESVAILNMTQQLNTGKVPFVLKAFKDILERVSADEFHAHLFNDEDRKLMDDYRLLPVSAQILICRFITRKTSWHLLGSLQQKYGANLDLVEALKALRQASFLDCSDKMEDLSELLNAMQVSDLQAVAKKFLRSKDVQVSRNDLINSLLDYSRRQSSLNGPMEKVIMDAAKKQIGECFRIAEELCFLFLCIFHLFSPSDMASANASNGQISSAADLINRLVNLLRQKNGNEITFGTSTGVRQAHPFPSRDDLHRYVQANMLELHVSFEFELKNFEECINVNDQAFQEVKRLLSSDASYEQLPSQFRKYTVPWVLFRMLSKGIEAMESQKKYEKAVLQLQDMIELSAGNWCPIKRSQWFERLALDLDRHLGRQTEALEVIRVALNDESVTEGTRRSLSERGKRILESMIGKEKDHKKKAKLRRSLMTLEKDVRKVEVPQHTIDADLLKKTLGGKLKTIFAIANETDGSVTALNVEAVARLHYIEQQGFLEGVHGEGSPWLSLFGLLFWDIIYDPDVPDAFISSQQWEPTDLTDPQFYARRKEKFDSKMQWIRTCSSKDLVEAVRKNWLAHNGQTNSLVNWTLFGDIELVERILSCMDGGILAKVFKRLASKFRQHRSGFPDLLLWNSEKKTFKVVEVKGPGDRVSPNQRLWLEFFVDIGAAAEICWVKGVPGKRIRKDENI